MNTVKFDKKNVKMVAHRGVSGLETENTNAAFIAAGNRSYYGIETDIHQTADGKYVLFHDGTTERVGGIAYEVEKTPFDTLRQLVLFDKNKEKERNDLRVSTLEEYISICKKYEKVAVLELKSAFSDTQIKEICDKIAAQDYLEGTVFISFGYENLVKLRKLYPDQAAQFLISSYQTDLIDRLKAYNLDLDIHYKALTEENVKALHEAGIKINCWTVDSVEDAERLASWGVDYITSNILE